MCDEEKLSYMSGPRITAATIVMLTGCLADTLLLAPQKPAPAPGARREVLALPEGNIEVFVADNLGATEPAAFVLRFYGNAQLANDVQYDAETFTGLPIEIWGVNYPGYGGSEGQATLANVASVARHAYAALAKRANGRPIIVMGNSMGTTAALYVAAHDKVAGLVLHNPPPLRHLVLRRYGWWNLWLLAVPVALQIPEELDSVRNAAACMQPALFISSSDDGVVPFAYQERVMKAYAGPWELALLRGAGHNT
ncbi:MAG: alpha/beta fold hydrolase, partial [Kofleriaceae bacterium]